MLLAAVVVGVAGAVPSGSESALLPEFMLATGGGTRGLTVAMLRAAGSLDLPTLVMHHGQANEQRGRALQSGLSCRWTNDVSIPPRAPGFL
jgi:hypothetical protein